MAAALNMYQTDKKLPLFLAEDGMADLIVKVLGWLVESLSQKSSEDFIAIVTANHEFTMICNQRN